MPSSPILSKQPLGFQWPVSNPFLFCAHHFDQYPKGSGDFGPEASLKGRDIGQDFDPKLPWRMYHGDKVPGFPVHPHRGFETITIVTKGMVDHSDSHGQAGRYGGGDVQWMTAGAGLQHSEMFPLINTESDNHLQLFQVWLNLPKANKMVEPHFKMLWREEIPTIKSTDNEGFSTFITLISGSYERTNALPPAPNSWAADPNNEVAIWLVKMEANAQWVLPKASSKVSRSIFFYTGDQLNIAGHWEPSNQAFGFAPDKDISLQAGQKDCHFLLLQGRPIQEPVVQYGPFVMNTPEEIKEAFYNYQQNQFGGWPWPRRDMVHGQKGRFARYADGREELK